MVWALVSIYFDSPQFSMQKNRLYKTLDYWFRDVHNFNISGKALGLVSLSYFVNDFKENVFQVIFY